MAGRLGTKGIDCEPNVTPLIDVVLVLLIIFMVVTPSVESRFKVALPEKDASPVEEPPPDIQPLVVHLDAAGMLELNNEPVDVATLVAKLRPVLKRREDRVVFFEADDGANFGRAVNIMDAVRGAGASHVGIVEPAQPEGDVMPAAADAPAVAEPGAFAPPVPPRPPVPPAPPVPPRP